MRATRSRFPAVKEGGLCTRVVEVLKDAIFAGRLEPGEALPELRLAREMKVSQATVREALVQLEQLGLVVRLANRGTHVTRFSAEEILERARLRIVLEGVAMCEAAPRMEPRDFEEAERLLAAFHAAAAGEDHFARISADYALHRFIWLRSRNMTVVRMLDQLTAPLFAFTCILRKRGMVRVAVVGHPHRAILDALRTGDPAAIRESVSGHIGGTYEAFLEGMAEQAGSSAPPLPRREEAALLT